MFLKWFIFGLLATLSLAEESGKREGKILSLFNVVKFKNEACVSTASLATGQSSFRNGTCYSQSECSQKGGSSKGSCASGFGVCCIFTFNSATNEIGVNDSYLQNPGFPSAYSATTGVTYTIKKCSNDVCWLRLDFEQFMTLGPSSTAEATGGLCQDSFSVTSSSSGATIPPICGTNTGQHIYIDMGNVPSDTATVTFAFGAAASTSRIWDIKASQIPCGANYAPPNGCLQYNTGLTGRITSFNFDAASDQQHLQNQRYSSCIRQEEGFCCVQYQVCADMFSFSFDQGDAAEASDKALTDSNCSKDFIIIEGSSNGCIQQPGGAGTLLSKYCGGKLSTLKDGVLNTAVCDCSQPFQVNFRTEADVDAIACTEANCNRGICLEYTQIPC